jgi:hypothetical protein
MIEAAAKKDGAYHISAVALITYFKETEIIIM